MTDVIKPVRYGILIGLLGIIFGIGWAFWLALGEERIEKEIASVIKEEAGRKEETVKTSLKRLGMGHSHSMALGLLTIALSLVLAFTSAPGRVKTVGSLLSGVGGILFPIAWIIMGFRTPALGVEGAHASIIPLAGIGVVCISSGILLAAGFLVKDAFK